MFGEPAAFAVFENGEPISEVMSQRSALFWLQRRTDEHTAFEALWGKHEAFTIKGKLDEQDAEARDKRQLNRDILNEHNGGFNPMSGDVVIYPDGTRHRISHVWTDDNDLPACIQTSKGGSWSWASSGHMSFSGSLFSPIPADSLTWEIGAYADVSAWFFHHEFMTAHNSVNVTAKVRVWRTTAEVPTS